MSGTAIGYAPTCPPVPAPHALVRTSKLRGYAARGRLLGYSTGIGYAPTCPPVPALRVCGTPRPYACLRSTIRELSTTHTIAPYASSVPRAQYRTSHSTIS
eukprot:3933990-Rhodomonas_salina.1